MIALACRLCGHVVTPDAAVIPQPCPSCRRETVWTTAPSTGLMKAPAMWTDEDYRFLRSIRIHAD